MGFSSVLNAPATYRARVIIEAEPTDKPSNIQRLTQGLKTFWYDFPVNAKSGVTVCLVSLPLSISLSIASGGAPVPGIISAFWGGIGRDLFGSSRFNIMGPTGGISGTLANVAHEFGPEVLPWIGVNASLIVFAVYLLGIVDMLMFIPSSVVAGFTLGVAMIMALNQLDFAFGIQVAHQSSNLVFKTYETLSSAHAFGGYFAPLMCLLTLVLLYVLTEKKSPIPPPIVATVVGVIFGYLSENPLILAAYDVELPQLATLRSRYGELKIELFNIPTWSPYQFNPTVLGASLSTAFVAILETLISARVADVISKSDHDRKKEVLGIASANFISGIFGGIPASAALARTSLNIRSGATSSLSSMCNCVFLLLLSYALLPIVQYLAMPFVAAIVIFVAYRMIDQEQLSHFFELDTKSFCISIATASMCVLTNTIVALLTGAVIALLLLLRRMATGHAEIQVYSGRKLIGIVDVAALDDGQRSNRILHHHQHHHNQHQQKNKDNVANQSPYLPTGIVNNAITSNKNLPVASVAPSINHTNIAVADDHGVISTLQHPSKIQLVPNNASYSKSPTPSSVPLSNIKSSMPSIVSHTRVFSVSGNGAASPVATRSKDERNIGASSTIHASQSGSPNPLAFPNLPKITPETNNPSITFPSLATSSFRPSSLRIEPTSIAYPTLGHSSPLFPQEQTKRINNLTATAKHSLLSPPASAASNNHAIPPESPIITVTSHHYTSANSISLQSPQGPSLTAAVRKVLSLSNIVSRFSAASYSPDDNKQTILPTPNKGDTLTGVSNGAYSALEDENGRISKVVSNGLLNSPISFNGNSQVLNDAEYITDVEVGGVIVVQPQNIGWNFCRLPLVVMDGPLQQPAEHAGGYYHLDGGNQGSFMSGRFKHRHHRHISQSHGLFSHSKKNSFKSARTLSKHQSDSLLSSSHHPVTAAPGGGRINESLEIGMHLLPHSDIGAFPDPSGGLKSLDEHRTRVDVYPLEIASPLCCEVALSPTTKTVAYEEGEEHNCKEFSSSCCAIPNQHLHSHSIGSESHATHAALRLLDANCIIYRVSGNFTYVHSSAHVARVKRCVALGGSKMSVFVLVLRTCAFVDLDGEDAIGAIVEILTEAKITACLAAVQPVVRKKLERHSWFMKTQENGHIFSSWVDAMDHFFPSHHHLLSDNYEHRSHRHKHDHDLLAASSSNACLYPSSEPKVIEDNSINNNNIAHTNSAVINNKDIGGCNSKRCVLFQEIKKPELTTMERNIVSADALCNNENLVSSRRLSHSNSMVLNNNNLNDTICKLNSSQITSVSSSKNSVHIKKPALKPSNHRVFEYADDQGEVVKKIVKKSPQQLQEASLTSSFSESFIDSETNGSSSSLIPSSSSLMLDDGFDYA